MVIILCSDVSAMCSIKSITFSASISMLIHHPHTWDLSLLIQSYLFPGEIRCYCNNPECQQTGHICISHAEKCFSKLYTVYDTQDNKTDTPSDEHGCVELSVAADPSHESICDGTGDVVKQLKRFEPLIMCCSDNMCNYRENQDIQVDIIDTPEISTGESVQDICISNVSYNEIYRLVSF